MSTLFTDDFNRADGDNPGSSWVERGNGCDYDIVSNALKFISGGSGECQVCYVTGVTFPADYKVSAKYVNIQSGSGYFAIGARRKNYGTHDSEGYFLDVNSGGTLQLYKRVAGSWSGLNAVGGGTPANGDIFKIEVEGTSIRGYRNGTLVVSATDSSLADAGDACVSALQTGGQNIYDDFLVEDFNTGSALTKDVSEQLALSDARTTAPGKATAESLAMADSVAKDTAALRSELIALVDSLSKEPGVTLPEILVIEDDALETLLAKFFSATLEEVLAVDDAASFGAAVVLVEALTTLDMLSFSGTKEMLERMSLTDASASDLLREIIEVLSLTDGRVSGISQGLLDALSLDDHRASDAAKSVAEILSLSDERSAALARAFAEIVAASDYIQNSANKVAAEQLTFNDTIRRDATVIFVELLSLSDLLAKTIGREFAEEISLDDLLDTQLNTASGYYTKTLVESLSLLDTMAFSSSKLLEDILVAADELAKGRQLTLTEVAALADFIVKSPNAIKIEELLVSEEVIKLYALNATERLALNDILSKHVRFTLEDIVRLADTFSRRFVQLFGLVRLLSFALHTSRIDALLLEASMLDVLRLVSPALHAVQAGSIPAIASVGIRQSEIINILIV